MDCKISQVDGVAVMVLSGDMSFQDHGVWRKMMESAFEMPVGKQVVDLTGLTSIDSAGLGMLLVMKDRCENAARDVFIRIESNGPVRATLRLAQFEKMIPFCE